jgi:aminopeptidase N
MNSFSRFVNTSLTGAAIIRMLASFIGDQSFRDGLTYYLRIQ